MEELIRNFGHLPLWGVVSNFSVDVFYDGLTYEGAVKTASEETKRRGTDAAIVFVVSRHEGPRFSKVLA